jgi:hypothetical protein
MRFQLVGRDEQSGEPVEPFTLEAEDEEDARNRATEMGSGSIRLARRLTFHPQPPRWRNLCLPTSPPAPTVEGGVWSGESNSV